MGKQGFGKGDREVKEIKFGTDGWRAKVAREYTFENVARCAAGVAADVLESGTAGQGVVVGYDTRFCSDQFARTAADTLAEHGIDVLLFDRPAPTPSTSFSVLNREAALGVMITASHNAADWNGFKVKSARGASAPQEQIQRIESRINSGGVKPSGKRGKVTPFNPLPDYIAKLRQLTDIGVIRKQPFKLVIDSMHGAGAGILSGLLEGGDLEIHQIRTEANPSFPRMAQPEPIANNLEPLSEAMREHKADCGIAFDGDADRLGIVDENGDFMYCGAVFSIFTQHLLEHRRQSGSLACSITISSMMEKICGKHNSELYRTPIGFKYVAPVMEEFDCIAGGEESGGYAFKAHIPDRDGIASALLFLEAMTAAGGLRPKEMLDALQEFTGPHFYERYDSVINPEQKGRLKVRLVSEVPAELDGTKVIEVDRMDGRKFFVEGGGWVGCRLSGTEPLVRIYSEAPTRAKAQGLIKALRAHYDA